VQLEECIGQRDSADTLRVDIVHHFRIDEEHDRHFRAFARLKFLLAETETISLVEIISGDTRRHIISGAPHQRFVALVDRLIEDRFRHPDIHLDLSFDRAEAPVEAGRHIGIKAHLDGRPDRRARRFLQRARHTYRAAIARCLAKHAVKRRRIDDSHGRHRDQNRRKRHWRYGCTSDFHDSGTLKCAPCPGKVRPSRQPWPIAAHSSAALPAGSRLDATADHANNEVIRPKRAGRGRKQGYERGVTQVNNFRYTLLWRNSVAVSVLLGSLALPLAASGAFAEERPAREKRLLLDELTVTTTGLGTPRATHTGNISKISDLDVEFIQPAQPAEALNRIPGVGIQQGSGAEHLTAIRSPVLSGGAGAGSFLYLEDSVPMRAAGFANVNALMEAMDEISGGIEVVRGPGGARYGSNAEHGLINFLSRPPVPGGDAELTIWGGPHDFYKSSGTASRTLSGEGASTHGIRGSFAVLHDGGFRADSGLEQQKGRLRYEYAAPETRIT